MIVEETPTYAKKIAAFQAIVDQTRISEGSTVDLGFLIVEETPTSAEKSAAPPAMIVDETRISAGNTVDLGFLIVEETPNSRTG